MLESRNDKWFIGDIKEALTPKEWKKVVRKMFKKGNFNSELKLGKKHIAIYRALWSDGVYNGLFKIKSGYVGCIKISDIDKTINTNKLYGIGSIRVIERDFETINNEGLIIFGSTVVDTRGTPEPCTFCSTVRYPIDRKDDHTCPYCDGEDKERIRKEEEIKKLARFYLSSNPKDEFKVIADQTYVKAYVHLPIEIEFSEICKRWEKAGWC